MKRKFLKSLFSCSLVDIRAFEIPVSGKIPEEMYFFCLAMMADNLESGSLPEFHKTEELKSVALEILSKRMQEYETSMEEDERLLKDNSIGLRHKMAIEVRLGEKKNLQKAVDRVNAWVIGPAVKRAKKH
jgi:N-lysine methyltransferase SETD6